MAYDPFWIEDFRGWPVTVDRGPGGYSGLGWTNGNPTPTVAMLQIVASTRFHSGKALRYAANNVYGCQYALPPLPGVARTYCWNQIRNLDYSGPAPINDSQGCGMLFHTGLANRFVRIVPNTSAAGLGGQYMLQAQNVAGGTFQTLAVSPSQINIGIKVSMALSFDPTTGTIAWFINDPVNAVYTGSLGYLLGVDFTAIAFGRLATGAAAGQCDWSDFWGFTNGAYPGPVEVRSAFPGATLPLQDWAPVGGTAVAVLSNTFAVTPAAYIESGTPGDVSQFTCPVPNTNVTGIYSASHEYYASRTEAGVISMNGQIGDSGVYTDGATVNPPQTTYQRFADYYGQINPNTGLNWLPADMSNNEIGYERS